MSLSSVLVDNARVGSYTTRMSVATPGHPSVPIKNEGETQADWVSGPWFACRIDWPGAPESRDAAQGRMRADQSYTLIYELIDENGGAVVIDPSSKVEVDSEELGRFTYEVSGEPTLDRKKRDLVCGEASLKRIVDRAPAGLPTPGRAALRVASSGSGSAV